MASPFSRIPNNTEVKDLVFNVVKIGTGETHHWFFGNDGGGG